jgi:uncharacterized protein
MSRLRNVAQWSSPNSSQENCGLDAYRNNVFTTINHLHEKLLLLRDRLHTDSARRIADRRHDFMMVFLHQFQSEWDVAVD